MLLIDLLNSPNTTFPPNATAEPAKIKYPPCLWILIADINNSRVRVWDTLILIPNAFFLLFLLVRLRVAVAKLTTSSSPIFTTFYGLVFLVSIIGVLRCVVSMTVNASVLAGDYADKSLWLILRFFLLATEMSVIVFGLAFGHLDSRTSIISVLVVAFVLSLIYSVIQGTLEFMYPDPKFTVKQDTVADNYDLFAHGGMIFWFTSSVILCAIYTTIVILPVTRLRQRFPLPTRKSFYMYAGFLACLNLLQAVGSVLLYSGYNYFLCVVNFTTFVYFSFFDPLVYMTFLHDFFRKPSPSVLYSYKPQVDEVIEDDGVALPYQTPYATDETFLSASYDSTHFNRSGSPLRQAGGATNSQERFQNPRHQSADSLNLRPDDVGFPIEDRKSSLGERVTATKVIVHEDSSSPADSDHNA